MKQLLKQCLLSDGVSVQMAWLNAEEVKEGIRVTLEDSDDECKWWEIVKIYDMIKAKDEIKDSHNSRKWFDNDLKRGTLKRSNVF